MMSIRKKASELFPLVPNEMLGPVSFPEGKQHLSAAGDKSDPSSPIQSPALLGQGAELVLPLTPGESEC